MVCTRQYYNKISYIIYNKFKKIKNAIVSKSEIIISTGGTGGHIFPAQAIAEKLYLEGYKIRLVCDQRALKYCDGIFRKIKKTMIFSLPPKNKISIKISNLLLLSMSLLKLVLVLMFRRPKLIIAFGGYTSCPASLYSIIFSIPLFLHEQNIIIGQVNRFFLPFANKLFISFPNTQNIESQYIQKVVLTGMPIRNNLIKILQTHSAKKLLQSKKIKILVIGGSQGTKIFSNIIPKAILNLEKSLQRKVCITHQVRKEDLSHVMNIYSKTQCDYNIQTFFDSIEDLYCKHNLVISRAGASSVIEILLFQKAAILVPFSQSKDNHQFYNAEYLSKNSNIVLKREEEFLDVWLTSYIKNCLINLTIIKKIEESYKSKLRSIHIDATNQIIKEINSIIQYNDI